MKLKVKPTKMTKDILSMVIDEMPRAYAIISGENDVKGTVTFYNFNTHTIMLYQVENLPLSEKCQGGIFAFHVHGGSDCKKPLTHYNPDDCPHPYHLGDLPPLFAIKGVAWGLLMIDKLQVEDIINRTIVIHENLDDFTTQPSGNPGEKLACGEIKMFTKSS